MSKNVLIFDFDGTIADTFHSLWQIGNRLAVEFEYKQMRKDDLESLKEKSLREAIKILEVPFLKIPKILSRARAELNKEISSIQPIKDLDSVLRQLKSNNQAMGILSTNSKKNIHQFLKNHNLEVFDFVSTSSKIFGKNRSLRRIIRKRNLESENIIYVADEARDIVAAKKANVKVAAVTWGFNSKKILEKHQPDYLLKTPRDLLNLQ